MALEILKTIRQAEEQAEALAQEAQQQARELIAAAEQSSAQRRREGGVRNHERLQAMLDERRGQVQAALREEAGALMNARRAQMEAARARLPQAAELIVKRVLEDGSR